MWKKYCIFQFSLPPPKQFLNQAKHLVKKLLVTRMWCYSWCCCLVTQGPGLNPSIKCCWCGGLHVLLVAFSQVFWFPLTSGRLIGYGTQKNQREVGEHEKYVAGHGKITGGTGDTALLGTGLEDHNTYNLNTWECGAWMIHITNLSWYLTHLESGQSKYWFNFICLISHLILVLYCEDSYKAAISKVGRILISTVSIYLEPLIWQKHPTEVNKTHLVKLR